MRSVKTSILGIILASAVAVSLQSASAAAPLPPPPATLDAAARHDIVAKLVETLRERYVFPSVGDKAAAAVSTASASGKYDGLSDPAAFTKRLTADLASIVPDKHLFIVSLDAPPPQSSNGGAPPPSDAGVVRADRLAGGVGYIEVSAFPPLAVFKHVADKAMSSLRGSRALIIDVRRNGGGEPESVDYLDSFLIRPGPLIDELVYRTPNTKAFTRKSYRATPTPICFADVPVYILISHQTFSGGEGFAYAAQALKRATLIGEVTGGGAHDEEIIGLGHNVIASIPYGRDENPITKTNWEGRGVQPDIAVPAKDALMVALQTLGQRPSADINTASMEQVFKLRSAPLPGSEAALRKVIVGLAAGKPDYASMDTPIAEITRRELPAIHSDLVALGALRSLTFEQPTMAGGDQYDVAFAKGTLTMGIVVGPNGRISSVSMSKSVPAK